MLHGKAFDVQLINHHIVPLYVGRLIISPCEDLVDNPALRHDTGIVATTKRKILVLAAYAIAEMGVAPARRPHYIFRIGFYQQLVRIESMPFLRTIGAVYPEAIKQSWTNLR